MQERSKKIVDFYIKANRNKEKIVLSDDKRDYSAAEVTVLACLDALVRYSVYADNEFNWDINKVIRMILIGSLDNDINILDNSETNNQLLNELKYSRSTESTMAKASAYRAYSKKRDSSNEVNSFMDNFSKLRTMIRKGHIYWGTKGQRLESILEHVYGTMILALGIEGEYDYKLDFDKLLKMLLIHETEEIKIGDLTEWDISKEEKEMIGKKAVQDVFSDLIDKDYYIKLIDEFNDHTSHESEYAFLCDKMEYDMQVKMYEMEGRYDFEHRPSNVVTNSSSVRRIIDNGANSVFDVHYEYDKHRYTSVPCMQHILEVTKKM